MILTSILALLFVPMAVWWCCCNGWCDGNCRYRNLSMELIAQATAPGISEFRRLQTLGELGGVVSMLADRGDWFLSQWEEAATELATMKADKVK